MLKRIHNGGPGCIQVVNGGPGCIQVGLTGSQPKMMRLRRKIAQNDRTNTGFCVGYSEKKFFDDAYDRESQIEIQRKFVALQLCGG